MTKTEYGKKVMQFWPLIAFLLIQSGALIVWGTRLESAVSNLAVSIKEKTSDPYRGSDAIRDFALRDQMLNNLQRQIDKNDVRAAKTLNDLKESITRMEAKLDRYIFKQ